MVNSKYTDEQVATAIEEHGSQGAAARALGMHKRTIERRVAQMRRKGGILEQDGAQGQFGEDGQPLEGTSTLTDMRTGEKVLQWVKTKRSARLARESLASFAEGLLCEIEPKPYTTPCAIKHHTDQLMTGIFIGDAHIGMYAYGPETKHSDFDTNIATRQIRDAIDYLVEKAEPTETGLLVNVGDLMHANTQHNKTYSGTELDVDTRHSVVMRKAAEVIVYAVEKMLQKFKRVVLCNARGNHDTDAAGAINLMIDFYYSRDSRVKVLATDGFFHYIEYGKWLLGVHHGDKQKPEALASSMARDMAQAWGADDPPHVVYWPLPQRRGKNLAGSEA